MAKAAAETDCGAEGLGDASSPTPSQQQTAQQQQQQVEETAGDKPAEQPAQA